MTIEISGKLMRGKRLRYGCSIDIEGQLYLAFVVNNKREFNITENGKLIFRSEYNCDSKIQRIFSYGYFRFINENGNEFFRLVKTGLLNLSTKLITIDGLEYKIPIHNSFSLAPLGLELSVEGSEFKANIADKKYLDIGIVLSYFCWVRQQVWDNSV